MPTVDTVTLIQPYGYAIPDWVLGDDRQFSGNAANSVNPPPSGDATLSKAYFTLKSNPNLPDSQAIIQIEITQSSSSGGQITVPSTLLFKIASASYQGLVSANTTYFYDFRTITSVGGVTQTIASGTVQWIQNVTDTDAAGTPSPFPTSGNPQFRGFINANPQTISNISGVVFNVGDFYMNSLPTSAGPAGWQCTGQGNPGTWIQFYYNPNQGSGFQPAVNITWGGSIPVSGSHNAGDIQFNISPSAGEPFGWICVTSGTPGTWKVMGLISL